MSLGGNDVGFAKIVNNCVYRFINFFHAGGYGEDCGKTLDESENKIENDLAREVENALLEFHKASADDAIIVVTGYGQFWNQDTEQCDQSNWNYWKNPFANRTPMTKALRGRMNKMVQDVNGKINGVVDKINSEANTSKFRFVNYNSGFDNSRFCEQHWEEPQKKEDEPRRDEMVLGQYYTKPGQIAPDQDKMPQTGEWVEFADAFAAEIRNSTQADVNPDYAAVSSDDLADGLIPISIVRVFHPTQRGHTKIAEAVRDTLLEQGDWPKANEQPEPQAQVACKYEHKFLDPNEHYDIVFRDFTDFDRLKNELKRCPLIVSHFKATEENIYAFKGDLPSQWHVVFAATWSDGSCFAKKIEAAMGLPEGHLKCPNSRTFFEREA